MARWQIVNSSIEHISEIVPERQYDEFSFKPNDFEERCSDVVGNNVSEILERNQERPFGFELW